MILEKNIEPGNLIIKSDFTFLNESKKMLDASVKRLNYSDQGPLLLTWFNFNPNMDK